MRKLVSRQVLSTALVAYLATSAVALAATVQNVAGPVSLNNGNGFRAIASGAPANAGDVVMAGAGGSAQIVYDNGCVENVESGTTVNVGEAPACTQGAVPGTGTMVLGGLAVAGLVGGVIAATSGGGGGGGGDGGGGGNPASP